MSTCAGARLLRDRGHQAVGIPRDRRDLGLGGSDPGGSSGVVIGERGYRSTLRPAQAVSADRVPDSALSMSDNPHRIARIHSLRLPSHPAGRTCSRTTATSGSTTGTGCANATTPTVREYLEAENAFTEAALAHLAPLRERIFEEIRGRVRETDAVARPSATAPHEYFRRTREGLQYPVHCRRPAGTPGLPDPDAEPGTDRARSCCSTRTRSPATPATSRSARSRPRPTSASLAYSTDYTGGERYELRFRAVDAAHRPRRRRARHLLRRRLGERRRHRLLHPPRRRDAAVAGLATPARHTGRRRRARVPGRRRAVLRVGRAHPQRQVPRGHVGVEAHDRGLVRRRRHAERAVPRRRRPARDGVEYHVEHHAVRRRRRPLLRAHQRRRRELPADGDAGSDPRARALDRGRRAPRRHPPRRRRRVRRATSCSPSGPTRSSSCASSTSTTGDRRTSSRCPTSRVLGRARRQPRVRHRRSCASSTRRWSRPPSSFDYDLDARAR